MNEFQRECAERIISNGRDEKLRSARNQFVHASILTKYSYNFTWLSRPIIQYPQDILAVQELIWQVRPDLIIETGIAHGGSLILSASMLALVDLAVAIESSAPSIDPRASKRKVLGIDIEIRAHNRAAIEAHPMFSLIQMMEGSSVAKEVIEQVHKVSRQYSRIMVFLDSMHTHDHVLAELEAYAPLVSPGSYCVVFDTLIEDMPDDFFPDRPWGPGNNPKTAVWEYLRLLKDKGRKARDGKPLHFEIDRAIENKLLITVAPDGFLRRVE